MDSFPLKSVFFLAELSEFNVKIESIVKLIKKSNTKISGFFFQTNKMK